MADLVGREQPYLQLATLVDQAQTRMDDQVVEAVVLHPRGPEVCLPNPRHHLAGVDPVVLAEVWEPTARALPERRGWSDGARRWLFTGRRKVNTHLARWLDDGSAEPVVVLTGAPGSGKSTILARFVVFTVPDLRRELAAEGVQVGGVHAPPEGFVFAATIFASRMTTEALFDAVAAGLGLRDRAQLQQLAVDSAPGPVPVVLIDALDEAQDPHDAVVEVLRPLAEAARGRVAPGRRRPGAPCGVGRRRSAGAPREPHLAAAR